MPIGGAWSLVGKMGGGGGTPGPVLSSVTPALGDTAGGEALACGGSNFDNGAQVYIDGNLATNIVWVNAGSITCNAPPGTVGAKNITVENLDLQTSTLVGGYEYWTPAQITGITAYGDSGKNVTLSVTIGEEDHLTDWGDASGNGNDLTQATSANQPIQILNAFGTIPSVQFTPAQWMALGAKIVQATGLAWMFVFKTTSTDNTEDYPGDAPITVFGDSGGTINNTAGLSNGTARYMVYTGAWMTHDGTSAALNDGAPHQALIQHELGGALTIRVDGALETASSEVYNVAANGYENIGSGYLHQDGFDGELGAYVAVTGTLSVGDRAKLEQWAKGRFGTP